MARELRTSLERVFDIFYKVDVDKSIEFYDF
jgi:hypothetical protein